MLKRQFLTTPVEGSKAVRSREEADVSVNKKHLNQLGSSDRGQGMAEYAVLLAMILVIVVGTMQLIGSSSNHALSQAASSIY